MPESYVLQSIDLRTTVNLLDDIEESVATTITDNTGFYKFTELSAGIYAVEVSLESKPGKWVVTVRDRGIGIPAEDLPYIFEPFYRADKSRTRKSGGFGLGLSMCKTIMDAHSGGIELSSELNRGTTVILTFPTKA